MTWITADQYAETGMRTRTGATPGDTVKLGRRSAIGGRWPCLSHMVVSGGLSLAALGRVDVVEGEELGL